VEPRRLATSVAIAALVVLVAYGPFFELFAAGLALIYEVIPVYGLAIILLTVVVRLILLPLSIKQTRSMREMQRIQPEIKKIQAKFKGDRQKLNEEMMKLYQEHGVNPFGGCLPLLMQMPVFIALYRVISTPLAYMGYVDANGDAPGFEWIPANPANTKAFEWVTDSSLAHGLLDAPLKVNTFLHAIRLDCSPSQVYSGQPSQLVEGVPCGNGIADFIPYAILIALMGFTTFYQQRQMQSRQPAADSPQAQQMQMMGKIMPLMLVVFSWGFPAGLTLYWLTTNTWSIGQQYLMLRVAPIDDPPPSKGGNGKATKTAKESPTKAASADAAEAETGKTKKEATANRRKRRR
jgi:YidC/Oxa1 family membrane protein insertase